MQMAKYDLNAHKHSLKSHYTYVRAMLTRTRVRKIVRLVRGRDGPALSSMVQDPKFFFKDGIYFLEGGRGREGEKHQCVVASRVPTSGDLASNPGMCLTGKPINDPLVRRPALNPLSHTRQGKIPNS